MKRGSKKELEMAVQSITEVHLSEDSQQEFRFQHNIGMFRKTIRVVGKNISIDYTPDGSTEATEPPPKGVKIKQETNNDLETETSSEIVVFKREEIHDPARDVRTVQIDMISNESHPIPEENFTCLVCGQTFEHLTDFNVHEKSHETDVCMCRYCGKTFNWVSTLRTHEKSHESEERKEEFQCDICYGYFPSKDILHIHKIVHRINKQSVLKCEQCDEEFTNKNSFEDHLKSHTDDLYDCIFCHKTFSSEKNLHLHEQTHRKGEQFQCENCNKWFKSKLSLQVHKYKHNAQRPYSCSKCGESFSLVRSLQFHVCTHCENYPFDCKHCGKKFALETDFKRHESWHTQGSQFRCSICEMEFSKLYYLRKHEAEHAKKLI